MEDGVAPPLPIKTPLWEVLDWGVLCCFFFCADRVRAWLSEKLIGRWSESTRRGTPLSRRRRAVRLAGALSGPEEGTS